MPEEEEVEAQVPHGTRENYLRLFLLYHIRKVVKFTEKIAILQSTFAVLLYQTRCTHHTSLLLFNA